MPALLPRAWPFLSVPLAAHSPPPYGPGRRAQSCDQSRVTSSVDDAGRTPYESNVNCSPVSGGISCQANFSAVPQGQRLVIQHISGGLAFDSDPKLVQVSTKGSPNQGISAFFVSSLVSTSNSLFDQAVLSGLRLAAGEDTRREKSHPQPASSQEEPKVC